MKHPWFYALAGVFMLAALAACNPTATPVDSEATPTATPDTPTAASTAAPLPSSTSQVEAEPAAAQTAQATRSASITTPERHLTAIPLTPAQIIQEQQPASGDALPTPTDQGLQKLLQQAQADLAKRLGLRLDQIDLVQLKFVTWPDKGFGCPRPGVVYPQVPQEGALIQFRVGKRMYDYHVGPGRPPFLCEYDD